MNKIFVLVPYNKDSNSNSWIVDYPYNSIDGVDVVKISAPTKYLNNLNHDSKLYYMKRDMTFYENYVINNLVSPSDIIIYDVVHNTKLFKNINCLKVKYSQLRHKELVRKIPYPDISLKRDKIIVLNNPNHINSNIKYYNLLVEEFPHYEFVNIYDKVNDLDAVFNEYKDAKLVLDLAVKSTNLKNIRQLAYYAMKHGCIFIAPQVSQIGRVIKFMYTYQYIFVRPHTKKSSKWSNPNIQSRLLYKLFFTVAGWIDKYNEFYDHSINTGADFLYKKTFITEYDFLCHLKTVGGQNYTGQKQ